MKVLACSDIHGNKKALISLIKLSKIKDPDIIICAGDISSPYVNTKKVLNELKKQKNKS